MLGSQGFQTFDVQYLGAAMLSQVSTGLGMLQKPLRDLYFAYQRPGGQVRLNTNLLTVTDKGLIVSQPRSGVDGNYAAGAETFYSMPSVQFWDVVQFVTVKEKDKRFKCAFEPLNFDQNRPRDNLFSTLDYKKDKHLTKVAHPVIFAIVLRRTTGIKALDLHAFVCSSDQQAFVLAQSLQAAHVNYRDEDEQGAGVYGQFGGRSNGPQPASGMQFQQNNQYGYQDGQLQSTYGVGPQGNVSGPQGNMPGPNGPQRGGYISEMWRMNQNGVGRSASNVGNLPAGPQPGQQRGYELTQTDLLGVPGGPYGERVYGNTGDFPGMRDPRFDSNPANLSRSNMDIYQGRNELMNDASKLRPPTVDMYGNNPGASRSLDWPQQQPQKHPAVDARFAPGPFLQSEQGIYGQSRDQGIYGQAPRDQGIYGRSPVPQSGDENVYGKSNFQMVGGFMEPSRSENKSYGLGNQPGWSVGEAKRATDQPLYGNVTSLSTEGLNKPPARPPLTSSYENSSAGANVVYKSEPGFFARQMDDEPDPPPRIKGTSPSYRRKFPAWPGEAPSGGAGHLQSAGQHRPYSPSNNKPLPSIPAIREPVISRPLSPSPQAYPVSRPTPAATRPISPAPQANPVPVARPPPVSNEPIVPGVRKSVFGIFPREPEVKKQVEPSRTRQISGGESGERPVALVQPRKVQGIRVLPLGDDIYGKAPISSGDAKRPDPYRPLANDVERKPAAYKTTAMVDDDPDKPIKDREIASVFGALNLNSATSQQSQNNFEKSLGYLP